MTAEQQARDMLERMGIRDAQSFTSGDLVELANLIAARETVGAVEAVKAAARMISDAALNLLQVDPHNWSPRPCATCKTISGLLGRPFGCDLFRQQHARKS